MDISLVQSTGIQYVDRLLQGIVGMYDRVFSARIRAWYLMGSYADGSAVPLSDIDLCVIFRNTLAMEEMEFVQAFAYYCGQISSIRLDISVMGERDLSVSERIMIKQESMLIYGEDIRGDSVLPSLDDYRRVVTSGPCFFLGRIR